MSKFGKMETDELLKYVIENYGDRACVYELVNRFTKLKMNLGKLMSDAIATSMERNRLAAESESILRQGNVMKTCMHNILRYFRESKDEILMSCGVEVVMHVTDILDKTVKELNNIKEGKE